MAHGQFPYPFLSINHPFQQQIDAVSARYSSQRALPAHRRFSEVGFLYSSKTYQILSIPVPLLVLIEITAPPTWDDLKIPDLELAKPLSEGPRLLNKFHSIFIGVTPKFQ